MRYKVQFFQLSQTLSLSIYLSIYLCFLCVFRFATRHVRLIIMSAREREEDVEKYAHSLTRPHCLET